jgi:two-component system, cell cycle response regulator
MLVADIDHFKAVNDVLWPRRRRYGVEGILDPFEGQHPGIDLARRLSGEEFVIIMPDTDIARLSGRRAVAG